jgi:hypothetical protein
MDQWAHDRGGACRFRAGGRDRSHLLDPPRSWRTLTTSRARPFLCGELGVTEEEPTSLTADGVVADVPAPVPSSGEDAE